MEMYFIFCPNVYPLGMDYGGILVVGVNCGG